MTFSIKAMGKSLHYQWIRDDAILTDDDHYQCVKTSCLSLKNATPKHTGYYRCEVSNEGGKRFSAKAKKEIST